MDEPIHLKQAGAVWWHSDDHASPNLSKTSLGNFFHEVLVQGAHIGEVWVFNRNYHRSAVFVTIFATKQQIDLIEKNTKFKFKLPPKIRLN